MAEATTVQTSATSSAAQSAAGATTQSSSADSATANTGHATKAELEAFQKTVLESLQKQSDAIGSVTASINKLKPKATETAKTLTEKDEADQKRQAFQTNREKFGALKAAAMDRGVPEKKAAQFARYVLGSDNAANILVKEAGFEYVTEFRESDERTVSISAWVQAFLKTEEGEIFLPPKTAGSSDGQSSAGKGTIQVHPYLAMSFEKIMEDKKRNPEAFMTYLQDHEADWVQKQKQWKP
jgi:hypothetical protein